MTDLTLVRHGKTALNEKGIYCGSGDPPLSPKGIVETKRTAEFLKKLAPDAVYTGCSLRAMQTAQIVSPQRSAHVMPSLREMNFGDFEGLSADDIARRMPEAWQAYLDDPLRFVFPGGDSVPDFLDTAYDAVRQIILKHDAQQVLVVTHKGVITAALSFLLHGDFSRCFNYDIRPSGIAHLSVYENTAVLTQLY